LQERFSQRSHIRKPSSRRIFRTMVAMSPNKAVETDAQRRPLLRRSLSGCRSLLR
jgi:hypothetical protein